jgi:hypothetical protein
MDAQDGALLSSTPELGLAISKLSRGLSYHALKGIHRIGPYTRPNQLVQAIPVLP